jgi:hypothetical protein
MRRALLGCVPKSKQMKKAANGRRSRPFAAFFKGLMKNRD